MTSKTASVIIVTHNQSNVLAWQLAALACQDGISQRDFEVIITDDNSTPAELKRMQQLADDSPLNTQVLSQASDAFWASRARNQGVRRAVGDVLVFLDGDMVPESDLLVVHLSYHAQCPRLLLAGNRLRRPAADMASAADIDAFWGACRGYQPRGTTLDQWQLGEESKRLGFAQSEQPWRVVFSANMSAPHLPEVLFDERFIGWGPEDWALAYRLTACHGFAAKYAADAVAYEVDALGDGVGNLFRVRTQSSIALYLANAMRFHDSCPVLTVEEVFWSLRKLRLVDDQWQIVPRDDHVDLDDLVAVTRDWLDRHGLYCRNTSATVA